MANIRKAALDSLICDFVDKMRLKSMLANYYHIYIYTCASDSDKLRTQVMNFRKRFAKYKGECNPHQTRLPTNEN